MLRTGIANLPLHHGKVPPWLFKRMVSLAREVSIAVVSKFGPEGKELLGTEGVDPKTR